MSSNVKPSWTATRLPFIATWQAHFSAAVMAREAPYLGALPTLITASLVFMALSGLVLSVHYDPAQGFASLQFIDRDVANGGLIHAFHETGTTMIFGAVYLSLFRLMLTRAYKAPGDFVWVLGVAQFALLLLVGYLGYALTDGAVSHWSVVGAADATARLTGVPGALGTWFFGGLFGPGTLARLAVFHVALALAIFGIVALHYAGRRAIAPIAHRSAAVGFHPYYTAQYFVAFVVFALIFALFVFFAPHFGENPLNAAPANSLIVPATIRAPWYLLPVSGFLLPGVWGGIIIVIARLGVLFALPWLDRSGPGGRRGGLYRSLVFVLAIDVIALTVITTAGPSPLGDILAAILTAWYFFHFLVLTPLVTAMEAA
jgi:ubiquinol-cytochrome c reductase cytochrome b subunit